MTNLIVTLIIAGIIAGLVNFFYTYLTLPLSPKGGTESFITLNEEWSLPKLTWQLALLGYVIMGIAGSLLTPLINAIVELKGLSNDLNANLLVLFGYGIVFGYSTNRILSSISNSIIAKVEKLIASKQNEEYLNIQNTPTAETFLAPLDAAVCPNINGWSKAPNFNFSPLKNMAWANNLSKDQFGCTRNGGNIFHAGIDLKAEEGTECYALADGLITAYGSGSELGIYIGLQFEVDGMKYGAGYCHLKESKVKENEKVKAGQLIGKTGKTGNVGTDKPHLHLEIHKSKWLTYSSEDERSKASLDPNHYV